MNNKLFPFVTVFIASIIIVVIIYIAIFNKANQAANTKSLPAANSNNIKQKNAVGIQQSTGTYQPSATTKVS